MTKHWKTRCFVLFAKPTDVNPTLQLEISVSMIPDCRCYIAGLTQYVHRKSFYKNTLVEWKGRMSEWNSQMLNIWWERVCVRLWTMTGRERLDFYGTRWYNQRVRKTITMRMVIVTIDHCRFPIASVSSLSADVHVAATFAVDPNVALATAQ